MRNVISDLISRSALLEALLQKKSLMAEIVGGRHPIAMEAVIEYIEKFQCAYNVDKVVEQLKANSTTTVYDYEDDMHNDYILQDKAIEIVRKGGVE